jgi:hypothetical protein
MPSPAGGGLYKDSFPTALFLLQNIASTCSVRKVFVCMFKTRNNGKYVNQLPGCYFKKHEIFNNWLIDCRQNISIIVHACSLTKNKGNVCITHWSVIN